VSRHGAIDLDWGDGTYTFRLGLGEIEELEVKRDLSLFTIARRLSPAQRDARLSDISEVLRIGLVGGGMLPVDALAKTRRYVDERPIDENRDAAYAVVLAGLARVHGDKVESPPGEGEAAKPNASTSPPSEETRS
jgi:hypothetical protein